MGSSPCMTSQNMLILPTKGCPSCGNENFENSKLLNGLSDFAQIFTVCSSYFFSFTDCISMSGCNSPLRGHYTKVCKMT